MSLRISSRKLVYAESDQPIGSIFGPYPGVTPEEIARHAWMSQVEKVLTSVDANLIASVDEGSGQILYTVVENIESGQPFRVWFAVKKRHTEPFRIQILDLLENEFKKACSLGPSDPQTVEKNPDCSTNVFQCITAKDDGPIIDNLELFGEPRYSWDKLLLLPISDCEIIPTRFECIVKKEVLFGDFTSCKFMSMPFQQSPLKEGYMKPSPAHEFSDYNVDSNNRIGFYSFCDIKLGYENTELSARNQTDFADLSPTKHAGSSSSLSNEVNTWNFQGRVSPTEDEETECWDSSDASSSSFGPNEVRSKLKRKYRCKDCGKICKNNAGLVSHVRIHSGKKQTVTSHGSQLPNLAATEKQTIVEGSNDFEKLPIPRVTIFKCKHCHSIFSSKNQYKIHLLQCQIAQSRKNPEVQPLDLGEDDDCVEVLREKTKPTEPSYVLSWDKHNEVAIEKVMEATPETSAVKPSKFSAKDCKVKNPGKFTCEECGKIFNFKAYLYCHALTAHNASREQFNLDDCSVQSSAEENGELNDKSSNLGKPHEENSELKDKSSNLGKTHEENSELKDKSSNLGKTHEENSELKDKSSNLGKPHEENSELKDKSSNLGKTHEENSELKDKSSNLGKTHEENRIISVLQRVDYIKDQQNSITTAKVNSSPEIINRVPEPTDRTSEIVNQNQNCEATNQNTLIHDDVDDNSSENSIDVVDLDMLVTDDDPDPFEESTASAEIVPDKPVSLPKSNVVSAACDSTSANEVDVVDSDVPSPAIDQTKSATSVPKLPSTVSSNLLPLTVHSRHLQKEDLLSEVPRTVTPEYHSMYVTPLTLTLYEPKIPGLSASGEPISPYVEPISPYVEPISPYVEPISPYVEPISPYVEPISPYVEPISPYVEPIPPYVEPIPPVPNEKKENQPKITSPILPHNAPEIPVKVPEVNVFECSVCLKTFKYSQIYYRHMKLHTRGSSFKSVSVKRKRLVGSSKRPLKIVKLHKCPFCLREFNWFEKMQKHAEQCRAEVGISCKTENILPVKEEIKDEQKTRKAVKRKKEKEEETADGKVWATKFVKVDSLKLSEAEAEVEVRRVGEVCESDECGEMVKQESKSEVEDRQENKTYKCPVCGKKLEYEDSLRYHMRSHKRIEKTPLMVVASCSRQGCSKTFTWQQNKYNSGMCGECTKLNDVLPVPH